MERLTEKTQSWTEKKAIRKKGNSEKEHIWKKGKFWEWKFRKKDNSENVKKDNSEKGTSGNTKRWKGQIWKRTTPERKHLKKDNSEQDKS